VRHPLRLVPYVETAQTHPASRQVSDEETRPLALLTATMPSLLPIAEQPTLIEQPTLVEQPTLIEQPTFPLAVLQGVIEKPRRSGIRLFSTALARLQKPRPEELLTCELLPVQQVSSLGAFPLLMLTNAVGLLSVSFSYYLSTAGYGDIALECFFLLGLLILFIPGVLRSLSVLPSRLERICSLCGLGLCFYAVEFMVSPFHFSSFDDFLHWRTADDILRSGHLFSPNAMLPVSPYYPGLEIVTNAVGTMTGLSTFYAGVVVIIAARFLMVLALFLLFERITASSRMAGIAVLVYMANPHFIFFDAIYNYETLALPLATFTLYLLVRYEITNKDHRLVICCAWCMVIVLTITHHMTDYTLTGLLLLWTMASFLRPASRAVRVHLTALTVFAASLAVAYAFLLPGNPVWSYLSGYFASALSELGHIVSGSSAARPLFVGAAHTAPLWDSIAMTISVVLVTLSLPPGLYILWQQYRRNLPAVTLGIFSLVYPASQLFRFTAYGAEITDRAAAFLFLSIACLITMLIVRFWPRWRRSVGGIVCIAGALSLILVGGVVVAVGPVYTDLPGSYLVSADMRSIEPEGIQAATWSLAYLGANNRIGTDRTNQMLMSTYGDQRVVTRLYDNVDIAPVFYAPRLGPDEVETLRYARVSYLVVDQRLSQSLPFVGSYFENDTPAQPISKEALLKFNTVPQLDRIFDSGDIAMYSTGAYLQ
jgi:hypothetical protein